MFSLTLQTRKVSYLVWIVSGISAIAVLIPSYLLTYPSLLFHYLMGVGVAVLLIGPSIISHFSDVKRTKMDGALPHLLDDVAESQDTGMTLIQALEEVSRRNYGPITKELKRLVAQLSWGVEFGAALESFAARIGTSLSMKVSLLLSEAVKFGGDMKTTFRSTSDFVRDVLALRNERQGQLRPFFLVIYVSNVVFNIIIIILYQSFILPLTPSSEAGVSFLRMPLTLGEFRSVLFDMAIIEAVFGGLAAGKFGTGRAMSGLKHSVVLVIVATVTFWLFF